MFAASGMQLDRRLSVIVLAGAMAAGTALWLWLPRSNSDQETAQSGASEGVSQAAPVAADGAIAEYESQRPTQSPGHGYVSSSACVECHEANHDSWYASYHRSMTQLATPDAVLGDFEDRHVTALGQRYDLSRKDGVCFVALPQGNPASDDAEGAPKAESTKPIVMTTGSHHMQVYWYPSGELRTLGQLPLIHLKEINDWIPRAAAFLKPPAADLQPETGRWNETCQRCHATFPRSKPIDESVFDTQVAEFGISCEACHGPGERHVAMHRAGNANGQRDPIINPKQLPHELQSQVCGQCHSMVTPKNEQLAKMLGSAYRPGKDLLESHFLVQDNERVRAFYRQRMSSEEVDALLQLSFYPDGMIRVSGREYNGLVNSPCFQRGEMSCMSCHQLHRTDADERSLEQWANHQLAPGMRSDHGCTQCHQAEQYGELHTHHPPHSEGSRCYNCHMPYSTYGLLKGIRSHQVSVPHVQRDESARRLNACNQCHLDQSTHWAASHLEQWFQQPSPDAEGADWARNDVAAGPMWALQGDAGQRALVAWSMGWAPALEASHALASETPHALASEASHAQASEASHALASEASHAQASETPHALASGDGWCTHILAELLTDPYDAVRFIAARSLHIHQGPQGLDLRRRVVVDRTGLSSLRDETLRYWRERSTPTTDAERRRMLLLTPDGRDQQRIDALLRSRDQREVILVE